MAASKSTLGAVKLAQSDGDLAAHITIGERILATGSIPTHSLVSYTAGNEPFIAHAWGSEVLFALLYRLGGLPLLAVVTGLVIALTHTLVVVFLRHRGVDPRWAITAGLMSLALSASHWLTRPHMFSILAAALTLMLLESRMRGRLIAFAGLFAVWANLHGGWMFGLLLIASHTAGDLIESKTTRDCEPGSRVRENALALLVAAVATFLTPYGPRLHAEVIAAVTDPLLAAAIEEYMPPNFQEIATLPFLLALMGTIGILAVSRRRMPSNWLLVVMMSAAFALRSFRNIALFGVTGWPLVALHAARSWRGRWNPRFFRDFARIDARAATVPWATAAAVLLLALGFNHGRLGASTIIEDDWDAGIFPVAAVHYARSAGLAGNVFHPWVWGGYLMREWPAARLHVDPLEFNRETLRSYTRIETVRQNWQTELDTWRVSAVLVRRGTPLARALAAESGWALAHSDSTAVLFVRRGKAAETPTVGAP